MLASTYSRVPAISRGQRLVGSTAAKVIILGHFIFNALARHSSIFAFIFFSSSYHFDLGRSHSPTHDGYPERFSVILPSFFLLFYIRDIIHPRPCLAKTLNFISTHKKVNFHRRFHFK